jgi:hypothetical protein
MHRPLRVHCCLQGVSLPASQTVPNYTLLSLVYGTALLAKRIRPVNAWTSYAAVSLLDVEGNFLVVSKILPCLLLLEAEAHSVWL